MLSATARPAALLLALTALRAQAPSFDTAYSALERKNPPGGVFLLRLTAAGPFHEGELIPIEFTFRAPAGGRYNFHGVLLDPGSGCGDLAHPCHPMDMRTFSKADPMLSLDMSAKPVRADLNGYVPRLKPGRYRAALVASRLIRKGGGPLSSVWGYAEPAEYLVSSRIEFTVIPATSEWTKRTVEKAVAVLESPLPNSPGGYQDRVTAARRLRFLQHPLAWEAAMAHYGVEPGSNDLLFGLWEAPRSAEVCALMRRRLAEPEQYVTFYYLTYLTDICLRARPDFDPRQRNAEVAARGDAIREEAAAALAAGLDRKTGVRKGAAIYSLLEHLEYVRNNSSHPADLPAWLPQLRREAAAAYFDLPPYMRGGLFSSGFWPLLRGPEMAALLRTVLAAKVTDYNAEQHWNAALRRLFEVAPEEARARILAEMRNPETRIDAATLALLPPESVPNMDDDLVRTLAGAQRLPGGNARMAAAMLARYASPRALGRIKAIFESQQNPCQPELMAYFLRVDPAYADAVFHRHSWDMHGPAPCAWEYFTITPKLRMHAVLERYLAAYLMHEDVRLKQAAAEALMRYGSPAAQAPLWHAYRYFHDFWKNRRSEITPMSANEMLECSLRSAIARARNWLAREPDLRLIESLCLTERCLWETQQDLEAWKPLRVEVWMAAPEDFRANVAQYGSLDSLDALQRKLAQFPAGTTFQLTMAPRDRPLAPELRRRAAAAGQVLTPAPGAQ